MSSIKRQVGEKLFLNLQLHDGEDNFPVEVVADLFNADGVKINLLPIELNHISGGYFVEASQTMPNTEFVLAQYSVLEPGGGECPHYTQESDRFDRSIPVQIPASIVPKPFAIVAVLKDNQKIRASVKTSGRVAANFVQKSKIRVDIRGSRTKVSVRENRIKVEVKE